MWKPGRRSKPQPAALHGTPSTRRQKNYSALTGYAYEYFYEGMRDNAGEREHVFTISGDRKNWSALSVFIPDQTVAAWQSAHGRALADNERYALAKMALFDAFDTRETPSALCAAPVRVTAELAEDLLSRLGLD